MNWFKNLKIRMKLLLSFTIISVITVITGYVGIKNIDAIDSADTFLYEKMTKALSNLEQISSNYNQVRVSVRDVILANDPSKI